MIETDTELYHGHLVAGEAMLIPGGSGARLSGSLPGSAALVIGLRGGAGERPFELVERVYDVELVRDLLAPGERLVSGDITAALASVRTGSVTLGGSCAVRRLLVPSGPTSAPRAQIRPLRGSGLQARWSLQLAATEGGRG